MSLLYSIMKPIVRHKKKGRVHRAQTWEAFAQRGREMQAKFRFELPKIKGFEFRDEQIDGYHCIVGRKAGAKPTRALMYFFGGGLVRWAMPQTSSIKRYIEETDRELWLPYYPLYPDHDVTEEIAMLSDVYARMLAQYPAEKIAWLGFSSGADLALTIGRDFIKHGQPLPMPQMMIAVSPCNLTISDESYRRMEDIEKRDIAMCAAETKTFLPLYDRFHQAAPHIWGNAATDDYTGFPKMVLIFGGDEIFAGEAPAYEAAFRRCGVKDAVVHVEPGLFHGYPMFTFVKEGKLGEDYVIGYLKA